MSQQEVAQHARPHRSDVAGCYRKHGPPAAHATGTLQLYLVIRNTGDVVFSEVTAPGVAGARLDDLDECVRQQAAAWHFPARGGFTNATISYRDL